MSNSQVSVSEQGGAQSQNQAPTPVSQVTDEELDGILNGEIDEGEDSAPDNEPAQEGTDATKVEEPKPDSTEARIAALEAQLKTAQGSLEKKAEEKKQRETHIQRLKAQLGQTRSELIAAQQQIRAALKEGFDDPIDQTNAVIEFRENAKVLKDLDAEERALASRVESESIFEKVAPKDVTLDDMAEVLAEQGLQGEHLNSFRANPHGFMSTDALITLAHRANDRKAIKRLLVLVSRQNDELNALKGKPDEMLSRIEKASKQPVRVSAASGGGVKKSLESSDLTKLSDAELEELLK